MPTVDTWDWHDWSKVYMYLYLHIYICIHVQCIGRIVCLCIVFVFHSILTFSLLLLLSHSLTPSVPPCLPPSLHLSPLPFHQPEVVRFSTNPDRMLADNILSQNQCDHLLELAKVHSTHYCLHIHLCTCMCSHSKLWQS